LALVSGRKKKKKHFTRTFVGGQSRLLVRGGIRNNTLRPELVWSSGFGCLMKKVTGKETRQTDVECLHGGRGKKNFWRVSSLKSKKVSKNKKKEKKRERFQQKKNRRRVVIPKGGKYEFRRGYGKRGTGWGFGENGSRTYQRWKRSQPPGTRG